MNRIFVQFHFLLGIYILIEIFLRLSGFYHSLFNFLSFFFCNHYYFHFFFIVLKFYLAICIYNLGIYSSHTYLMYTVILMCF